jgi:hypothetical protein
MNSNSVEISVSPPETLVRYNAPLFGGTEPSETKKSQVPGDAAAKLEDMVNSMLPPRFQNTPFFINLLISLT